MATPRPVLSSSADGQRRQPCSSNPLLAVRPMSDDIYLRFGTALAIGLVIGLERGWRDRNAPAGSRTAGIRTFTLSALLGASSAALATEVAAPVIIVAALIAFAGAFSWFKAREANEDDDFSVTTVVAALLTFILGAYSIVGSSQAAAAVGVASAALLAGREYLHEALTRLTWLELRSAFMLLAMTVIVLPRLPDRTIGPFGNINPREIWMFTVLAGAISYAGYISVRLLGAGRGLILTSAGGALISSTAVTLDLARRARAGGNSRSLAGAASLASAVSILRVLAILTVVEARLVMKIVPAVLVAAAVFTIAAAMLSRAGSEDRQEANFISQNPLELLPLIGFAGTLAVVQLAVGWLASIVGPHGLLPSAALVGVVDVDVAVLTAARNMDGLGGANGAAIAIHLAIWINAVARVLYALVVGPFSFWAWIGTVTLAASVLGFAAWMAMSG